MNRRSFLSALAATSLTPILPPQVFASGGIVNPDHCGFVGEIVLHSPEPFCARVSSAYFVSAGPTGETIIRTLCEKKTIQSDFLMDAFMIGDGETWTGGLIRT